MLPDVYLLAKTLHDRLHAAWTEAGARADVDCDALLVLWERLQAIDDEIGRCLGRPWAERGDLVAALRDLEGRVQGELREVQSGAFDATPRAV